MHRNTTLYLNHLASPNAFRQRELDECLRRNLENGVFDRVVVLAQSFEFPPAAFKSDKLIWHFIDCRNELFERPTFLRFFDVVNRYVRTADEISVIANGGIYFDQTLKLITSLDLDGACLALTRWDLVDGEPCVFYGDDSQDVWILQGAIKPLGQIDFPMGVFSCDNRLAWELAHAGYNVVNPSYDIRCHCLCQSGIRLNVTPLSGPGENVRKSTLRDCGFQPLGKCLGGCIAFSLFGNHPKYLVGAVENAKLARHIYPGWTVRFYVDSSVPSEIIRQLRGLEADIVSMPNSEGLSGTFWRFRVADDKGFGRWLVRDADSRLNYRDRRAVDEWIESGAPFHVMRDHPGHHRPIIAFGFGGIFGIVPNMTERVERWRWKANYGNDEDFLQEEIWPLVKDCTLVHSSIEEGDTGTVRPFPTDREDFRFVGERCFEDEHWSHGDRRCLISAETAKKEGSKESLVAKDRPLSSHFIHPILGRRYLMQRKIVLYVNHYCAGDPRRQSELDDCLRRNAANRCIDRIVILGQSPEVGRPRIEGTDVTWVNVDCSANPYERPTFRNYFDLVNRTIQSPYDLSIVANSDIYFDESLAQLRPLNLEGSCLALARWDFLDGEATMVCQDNAQDTWIFQGAIRPVADIDFPMGIYGCDNRLAWALAHADYNTLNPCYDIRGYHHHASGVRYNGHGVGGSGESVRQCALADCGLSVIRPSRTGCIAFSLFGDELKYRVGAVENAKLARQIYPGWTVRCYVDSTIPLELIQRLKGLEVDVVMMPDSQGRSGTFWRLRVADDKGFARWIVRDLDSRLSYRERRAVDDWIESGCSFHVMRDHPGHQRKILGCAFGGVGGSIASMGELIDGWPHQSDYGNDDDLLEKMLWPLVKDSVLVHSSIDDGLSEPVRPFPTEREYFRFVGERCFEDEHWSHEDRRCLIEAEADKMKRSVDLPPSIMPSMEHNR